MIVLNGSIASLSNTDYHRQTPFQIHIDAHSDLDYPELVPNFPLGRIPQNDLELSTMMQANDQFIQSSVIAQLINTTYVIYPPWVANDTGAFTASLGVTVQHGRRQICLCFFDELPSCQARDWKSPLNTSQISLEQCELKWPYNHLELNSEDAPGIIRSSERWSIQPSKLNPLILDIDEDFFGVHLPARNLTDTGVQISKVKEIDTLMQDIFCPESPDLERVIDQWFTNVVHHARHWCFQYPTDEYRVDNCADKLHQLILRDLRTHASVWLCETDVNEISYRVTRLFANSGLTPEQLYVLGKIGLCFTMAWSTHLYEPRMRLKNYIINVQRCQVIRG
ncbi:unnamed protein product [Echinostoma caproni]|uniref:Inorganic diphosphatase n=1 Tax=Echinostoma caproni TaxID=27848 RepID=A0A183AWE9_9TREM|nr:unnamed protein product [Echinostoma caproni]